jgi:hypothetical protein
MEDYLTLAPDKTRARKFLYHKDGVEFPQGKYKTIIVYLEDAKKYYPDGWENTPAAFFNMKKHGVPEEKMPELHQEIDKIKDLVNDEINLESLDAKGLKEHAKKYYPGLKYNSNANRQQMLDLILKTKADVEKENEEFTSDDIPSGELEKEGTEDDNSTEDSEQSIPESGDQSGGDAS